MSRFTFPPSSSPPSTPGGQTPDFQKRPLFSTLDGHASTTPAGPPPSSTHSFTPADPPPSTIFGSSQLGTGVSKLRFGRTVADDSLFGSSAASNAMGPSSRTKNGTPAKPFGTNTFKMPSSSPYSSAAPFGLPGGHATVREEEEEIEEEDELEEEDEPLPSNDDMDAEGEEEESIAGTPAFKGFTSINVGNEFNQSSSMFGRHTQNTTSASRSKFGTSAPRSDRKRRRSALPGAGNASVIPSIARDLASRSKDADLLESDDMIMGTEDIISQATEAVEERGLLPEVTSDILSRASMELLALWSSHSEFFRQGKMRGGLGPGESAGAISKATFISSLLLALHHPPLQQTRSSQSSWGANRSMAIVPFSAPKAPPMPRVLLDWLDKYHLNVDNILGELQAMHPNVTAHDLFWEGVLGLVLRAKFKDVIQLFNEADFRHAASAVDDGEYDNGYHGVQLQIVQNVVARARQLLESSPAIRHGDWQINNADWSLFRRKVDAELDYLAETAEGADRDDDQGSSFQAENFGVRDSTRNLTQTTRRAQSNVPWTVYQNLKIFYNILLGSSAEIISQSQDWLEASLSLTIWWDGTQDENITTWSLDVSRQSGKIGKGSNTEDPYLSRLSAAFLAVTDPGIDDTFQINSMSHFEVGIASVLQGNIEGVLGSLRTFSLVIASALSEIGAMGGWVRSSSVAQPTGLDEGDLMVLSYGQNNQEVTKDEILLSYAQELFEREELEYKGTVREGWELAISIATRLDHPELAKNTIAHLLNELHLSSQDRMDKLVILCTDLGLEEEARSVSERYADQLMDTTAIYGAAMICYARAHATQKLRTLVSLLVSYSLVSSVAYPLESELDPSLSALLNNPRLTLSSIAQLDPNAASLLQFHLPGYASLRKFYTLRDAEVLPPTNPKTHPQHNLRPLARTRQAAKYLVATITSAADPIYGGLYDPQRESAVQVDGLLALLGEASALLISQNHQHKRIFSKQQIYDLLTSIEDIQTVNERVYTASQECFNATLQNYSDMKSGSNETNLPDPRAILKKSTSGTGSGSGSGSNFSFSMMGSEMLSHSASTTYGAPPAAGRSSGTSSGVLIPSETEGEEGTDKIKKIALGSVQRGWDWRAKFIAKMGDEDSGAAGKFGRSSELLLDMLRRGLAVELSSALLRGDD